MSILGMSRVVARHSISTRKPTAVAAAHEARDIVQEYKEAFGRYIPAETSMIYIPLAGGLSGGGASKSFLFWAAVIGGLLSCFSTWVVGHAQAVKGTLKNVKPPNLFITLGRGWYEILMAGWAFFVWATAMPGSWYEWRYPVLPGAVVAAASLLIAGGAVLLNRSKVN